MNIQQQVGLRLRAARKAAGFKSAINFTDKYALSASTYSQHETGQRSLNLTTLVKYSQLLEISSSWLLTGEGVPYKNHNVEKELCLALNLTSPANNFSSKLQCPPITKSFCQVDMKLFSDILHEMIKILTQSSAPINETVIDFCFDIYNSVIATPDDSHRQRMVSLAVSSILKGYAFAKEA